MPISDEAFNEFRTRAGQVVQHLADRLAAVDGRPAVDAATQQWNEGRQLAQSKGYSAVELDRLERLMVERGISRHADAVQLDPVRPNGSAAILGGLPQEEFDMLMSGDDQGFLSRSLARIRGEG